MWDFIAALNQPAGRIVFGVLLMIIGALYVFDGAKSVTP